MKSASLALFLLGVVCSSAVGQILYGHPSTASYIKTPNLVVCEPDRVVLYPSNVAVSTNDLKNSGNALDQLLDKVEKNTRKEFIVLFARPKSAKCFRTVRNSMARRLIDVKYDVLDEGAKPVWNPKDFPETISSSKQPVFFECRRNEVFFVDKENLDDQVEKLLSSLLLPKHRAKDLNGFLKELQTQEVGNEYYKVNPNYLITGILALDARPGMHGDAVDKLDQLGGKFQKALSQRKPDGRYIAFIVRDDSFPAFRKARTEATKLGFETVFELLPDDEPIKFGAGDRPHSVLSYPA